MTTGFGVPAGSDTAGTNLLQVLRPTIERRSSRLRQVADGHRRWPEPAVRSTGSDSYSGTAVRPALALLSARAAGGDETSGVAAGVAVDLLDTFSQLQDSAGHGGAERRRRPTASTVFDATPGILVGDALLVAAFEALMTSAETGAAEAVQVLSDTVLQLIAAQSTELELQRCTEFTLAECLSVAGGTTASLFSCAASLGAVLLGSGSPLVTGLASFGWHLGMAIRLAEDLLGIWGDPQLTGKPPMADLRARRRSVPVAAALHSPAPPAAELRRRYLSPAPPTGDDLPLLASLVEEAGGRRFTVNHARHQRLLAERHLARLRLAGPVRAELSALTGILLGPDL